MPVSSLMSNASLLQDGGPAEINSNQMCFVFISSVHFVSLLILMFNYGREFAELVKWSIILYALAGTAEKVCSIFFYLHTEYFSSDGEAQLVDADMFAACVRLITHVTLSIALIAEICTTVVAQMLATPIASFLFAVEYFFVATYFDSHVKDSIHSKIPFIMLTTSSIYNMTLLFIFCICIACQTEKSKPIIKIVGFHAIIDIMHNFLIQLLLGTNTPILPAVLILVNYAKDLFFMFVYVVRVINASIVEVGDSDTLSTISQEDLEEQLPNSARRRVEMVKY